jgi:hypothetical protein
MFSCNFAMTWVDCWIVEYGCIRLDWVCVRMQQASLQGLAVPMKPQAAGSKRGDLRMGKLGKPQALDAWTQMAMGRLHQQLLVDHQVRSSHRVISRLTL